MTLQKQFNLFWFSSDIGKKVLLAPLNLGGILISNSELCNSQRKATVKKSLERKTNTTHKERTNLEIFYAKLQCIPRRPLWRHQWSCHIGLTLSADNIS